MVARALMPQPDLLILDEPTTGLDPQARQLTWEKLRQLKRTGVTQIMTTHYMEEAAVLCDRIVIVDRGRIVAEGAPADLIRIHIGREVVELHGVGPDGAADGAGTQAADRVLAAAGELADAHELHGDLMLVYTRDGEGLLHRIREQGVAVEAATLRRATLEDVFLKLTGRMLRE
jgi:lipooligosaccharide transport system ATP-binding protein